MTSSLLYALVGAAWGLVLGVVAGLAVTVFAPGVAWLWLFGDDPWPQAVSWVLPLIGAGAGLVVFVMCLVIGFHHGRNLERAPAIAMPAGRRTAYRLLALALASAVVLVGAAWLRVDQQAVEREAAADKDARFARLRADRHLHTAVTMAFEDAFEADIRVQGNRDGPYRLVWAVREALYDKTLLEGSAQAQLDAGDEVVTVRFAAAELARAYHAAVVGDAGASYLVDQRLRFEFWLETILTEAEHARLPPHETQNLRLGYSELRDTGAVAFRVRLEFRAGRYVPG